MVLVMPHMPHVGEPHNDSATMGSCWHAGGETQDPRVLGVLNFARVILGSFWQLNAALQLLWRMENNGRRYGSMAPGESSCRSVMTLSRRSLDAWTACKTSTKQHDTRRLPHQYKAKFIMSELDRI